MLLFVNRWGIFVCLFVLCNVKKKTESNYFYSSWASDVFWPVLRRILQKWCDWKPVMNSLTPVKSLPFQCRWKLSSVYLWKHPKQRKFLKLLAYSTKKELPEWTSGFFFPTLNFENYLEWSWKKKAKTVFICSSATFIHQNLSRIYVCICVIFT